MSKNIAIIKNHSYDGFSNQASSIKEELQLLGNDIEIFNNLELSLMSDDEIKFEKCVFLDKDIIIGIRLELLGIRLYNNIGAIELCDDKRRTYELLKKDFKIPKTIVPPLAFSQNANELFIQHIEKELSYPLIAKEAFGSLGEQVFMINNRMELLDFYNKTTATPHLYQQFVEESRGRDIRVYVVANKAICAMERFNETDFRANISMGSGSKIIPLSETIKQAAENISHTLGLDFCGVDFLYSNDEEPYICEVNSNALFSKISSLSGINIARLIAEHVNKEMNFNDIF